MYRFYLTRIKKPTRWSAFFILVILNNLLDGYREAVFERCRIELFSYFGVYILGDPTWVSVGNTAISNASI